LEIAADVEPRFIRATPLVPKPVLLVTLMMSPR
jgi:hypothetical protein